MRAMFVVVLYFLSRVYKIKYIHHIRVERIHTFRTILRGERGKVYLQQLNKYHSL